MKLFAMLLLISLPVFAVFAQGWQWQNNQIQGTDLACVAFTPDGHYGWATSHFGDVLYSNNYGTSWTLRTTGSEKDLRKVVFMDSLHGWAVSWSPEILYTSNGGLTWNPQFVHDGGAFADLAFVSSLSGWAVGGGMIFHTSDGGASWVVQDSLGFSATFYGISFRTAQEGWAAGTVLRHTTNAGATWTTVSQNCPVRGKIQFLPGGTGFALAEGADFDTYRLLKTTNGGLTWLPQLCGADSLNNILDFDFAGDSLGRTVGIHGTIYRTNNLGLNWVPQVSGTTGNLRSVRAVTQYYGWVAGDGGLILHTTNCGTTWNVQAGNAATAGGQFETVKFFSSTHGWAGGDAGLLWKTTNGGTTWMSVATGHSFDVRSIAMTDAQTVWVAGASDTILQSTNGGATWSVHILYHSDYYNWPTQQIATVGTDYIWILADSLYRSTDGGSTWTGYGWIDDVWMTGAPHMQFTDANNGWITSCGDEGGGVISHTTDGGQTWAVQYSDDRWILGLSFINADTGWASLERDGVLYTTNGGIDWTLLSSENTRFAGPIQFTNSLNGWLMIGAGLWHFEDAWLLHTSDGGVSWQEVSSPAAYRLRNFDFTDAGHGWAVGGHGAILRYQTPLAALPDSRAALPVSVALAAYPNPFNPNTTLAFDLPASGHISLRIYDLTGRLVTTLADRVYAEGNYRVDFDGADLPSGVYFARLEGNRFSKTQKLVLLK